MGGNIKNSPENDRRDAVRHLLLDMISGAASPDLALMAALSAREWEVLADLAGQHRLMPLLHHRLAAASDAWPVPPQICETWREAYRESALHSLAASALISNLHRLLDGAGIPYAALKGAFLAWHAWPHPALRPLRDIDILVPRERAIEASALLLGNGFQPIPGGVPADAAIEHHKHLAPVVHAKSGIAVEIHMALVDPAKLPGGDGGTNFSSGALSRRRTFAEAPPIRFLDSTDTLLHLIVHAALDHEFDNGPLVFGDVACLARRHPPDWPVFWRRACELGAERTAQLVIALAEQFEGPLDVERPAEIAQPPQPIVDAAALMALCDFEQRQVRALGARLASANWRQRFTRLMRLAVPRRHVVENHALTTQAARPLGLAYLWWAADRVQKYRRGAFSAGIAADVRAAARVSSWLAKPGTEIERH